MASRALTAWRVGGQSPIVAVAGYAELLYGAGAAGILCERLPLEPANVALQCESGAGSGQGLVTRRG